MLLDSKGDTIFQKIGEKTTLLLLWGHYPETKTWKNILSKKINTKDRPVSLVNLGEQSWKNINKLNPII